MDSLKNLLNRREDLDFELYAYLEEDKSFGKCIRHPLVYSVPHCPEMNALVNAQLRAKSKAVMELFNEKKWDRYVWLHERPHRLNAFRLIEKDLEDSQYWKLLSYIWIDSENIWQNQKEWKKLLKSRRRDTRSFMDTEEDRTAFKNLPEEFVVYRGCIQGLNDKGLSYTLNAEVAEKFANRSFHLARTVISRKVRKSQVFAYLNTRSEEEIILI